MSVTNTATTHVSAELQLSFITQIQSRLIESKAVTTYKYALLHAIADLCVLKYQGAPHSELTITKAELADAWIDLYEGHSKPYTLQDGTTEVLKQKTRSVPGATVLSLIDEYMSLHQKDTTRQKAHLIKTLKHRLENPITRLYAGESSHDNFLYHYEDSKLTLKPCIAFCFREHYSLITQLIRERWLHFVRVNNTHVLSESQDLRGFLFGVERRALTPFREALHAVGEGDCFYCKKTQDTLAVDHFVPWSVYATDFGHNFVLACTPCNSSKSDHLSSLRHVERWVERNEYFGASLAEECDHRGLSHNLSASYSIADWAYQRHLKLGGELWVKKSSFEEASLDEFTQVLPSY